MGIEKEAQRNILAFCISMPLVQFGLTVICSLAILTFIQDQHPFKGILGLKINVKKSLMDPPNDPVDKTQDSMELKPLTIRINEEA